MEAIELASDAELVQCGNGAAAVKSGSHSSQRSASGSAPSELVSEINKLGEAYLSSSKNRYSNEMLNAYGQLNNTARYSEDSAAREAAKAQLEKIDQQNRVASQGNAAKANDLRQKSSSVRSFLNENGSGIAAGYKNVSFRMYGQEGHFTVKDSKGKVAATIVVNAGTPLRPISQQGAENKTVKKLLSELENKLKA